MLDIKEQVNFIAKHKPVEESLNCLIEEMSELTQALCKRNRGLKSNIEEEVGHVYLMLFVLAKQLELDEYEIDSAVLDATFRFSDSF